MLMQQTGNAAVTAPGGVRTNDIVLDGVYLDAATGQYVKNENKVTNQQYWRAVTGAGNLGIGEANIYSASNIRLRNISLGYTVPSKALANTIIQSLKAGFTVTNVLMIHSNMNGIDPESVFATSTNATGFEFTGLPTTRSFVFNVSIGF